MQGGTLTRPQMAALVDEVVKLIVCRCGPADAIMASVGAVKIIGELARIELGNEAAEGMLVEATERARALRVEVVRAEPETDPFVIEPTDPFSLPEDK